MNVINWICRYACVVTGAVVLVSLAVVVFAVVVGIWLPNRLRTRQDRANAAQIARIIVALSRIGSINSCLSYNIEELCWFCQEHGIEARDTKHSWGTTRSYTQEVDDEG